MKTHFHFSLAGLLLVGLFGAQTATAQTRLIPGALIGDQVNNNFQITAAPLGVEGPYVEMVNNTNTSPTRQGSIGYIAGFNSNPVGISHIFYTRTANSGGWTPRLQVRQDGQVIIGDQAPANGTVHADSRLAVDGKLLAKSIYVTSNGWADFVFEPGYQPMTLPALESYLQKNKHLPYIPSAQEVEANGINVADMNAKLLQTVEELTLHVIALSKQVEQLKAVKAAN